jgi:hypothetical protein
MQEESRTQGIGNSSLFIAIKIVSLLVLIGAGIRQYNFSVALGAAVILCGISDFVGTVQFFGLALVGLKWYFSRTEAPRFPFMVFSSRPFPFIPTNFDSNAFWLGLLFSFLGHCVCTVVFLVRNGLAWFCVCGLLWLLSFINIWGFHKCHLASKEEAENAARVLLLDTSVVAFQPAVDPNVSDPESEKDKDEKEELPEVVDNEDKKNSSSEEEIS